MTPRFDRRPNRRLVIALAAAGLMAPAAQAAPSVGKPAPAFQAVDAQGKTRSLSEFRGKTVVLEWTNSGCPYVRKHYDAGSMQAQQAAAARDGVVWLSVVSSAPGMQGYLSAADAKGWKAKEKARSAEVLLDPKGVVGRAYDARTTPHMYVIDRAGTLVYMGGIDDKPSSDPASLKGATNYVTAALADVKAGRAVAQAATRPYGCSVKYGSAD
jgi:peroxiredoxin